MADTKDHTLVVSLKYDGDGIPTQVPTPLDPTRLRLQGRVKNGLVAVAFPK
jgi:hypothetical protein